jgi:predicted SnoaL-like aldol condensation-catalyzing enzyme
MIIMASGNDLQIENATHDRKQAAVQFFQLVVAGRIDEAYQKHVDMQGKHHNPFFPAGFPALQKAMIENHGQFPNKRLIVKLVPARRSAAFRHAGVLGDGDLVAVHSHLVLRAGEEGMTVVHLFRFQGDRIVEMWDCGQPLPTDSPNKDGAF